MAFTVTSRGHTHRLASTTASVSDTFTPAANSLLLCVISGDSGLVGTGITDTFGGGSWVKIFEYQFTATTARHTQLWACLPGASPSNGAITCSHGYQLDTHVEFFEITGADTSGTTANAFGVTGARDDYSNASQTLTLSAFASSTNMTFAWAFIAYASTTYSPTWTDGTFTTGTLYQVSTYAGYQAAWLTSEDTSVVNGISPSATKVRGLFAVEIKAASAGASGNPWYYFAQQ